MSLTPSIETNPRLGVADGNALDAVAVDLPDPNDEPPVDFFFGLDPVQEDSGGDSEDEELCVEPVEEDETHWSIPWRANTLKKEERSIDFEMMMTKQ